MLDVFAIKVQKDNDLQKYINRLFSIRKDVYQTLQTIAKSEGLAVSHLVRIALNDFINKYYDFD